MDQNIETTRYTLDEDMALRLGRRFTFQPSNIAKAPQEWLLFKSVRLIWRDLKIETLPINPTKLKEFCRYGGRERAKSAKLEVSNSRRFKAAVAVMLVQNRPEYMV